MGFFDRFLKAEEKTTEIKFSGLDAWLDKEIARSGGEIVRETKPLLGEILKSRNNIRKTVLELEGLECPDDLPKRFKNIIRTSKPKYVSSMLAVLDEITADEKTDYESILDFQGGFSESLEKIAKVSFSHGRYLPSAFEKNLDETQNEIKNLVGIDKKLKEKIESCGRVSLLSKAKSAKRELDGLVENKKALWKKRNALKRDLDELNADLTKKKAEHARILEDDQLGGLRKSLAEIKGKKSGIENGIHENLTPLKRPLRKYRKLAITDKRLTQEAENSIDGYIENPVGHFLSDKHLREILTDMKNAINEGRIEIKNPEKVGRAIGHVMEALNPALADEHKALSEQEKQIEDEIKTSSAVRETKRAEAEVGELEHKIESAGDELMAAEKRERESEDRAGDMKKQLQSLLNESNVILSFEK